MLIYYIAAKDNYSDSKIMGLTWGPPGSCRPQMGPCWPHESCYQGNLIHPPSYITHSFHMTAFSEGCPVSEVFRVPVIVKSRFVVKNVDSLKPLLRIGGFKSKTVVTTPTWDASLCAILTPNVIVNWLFSLYISLYYFVHRLWTINI